MPQTLQTMIIPLAIAFLVYPVVQASAQTHNCAQPQSQLEMTICAGEDYDRADAQLNAVYKQARAAMKSIDAYLPANRRGAAQALLDAQRAWIAFRDAACKAEGYQFEGGTMQPMVVLDCKARLTRQRTQDLTHLIQNN